MKKCSHGDLVPVTVDSIRKGASEDDYWVRYSAAALKYKNIKYICNRILLSKLIRTMTEIK